MNKKYTNKKQRMERGMTLIEIAIALMLVAVVIAGIVTWMSNINQQLQLRGDAKHFSSVARAAQLYLKGEQGTLLKEYDSSSKTKIVSVKNLHDKGYLATEIQAKLGKKQQDMTMLIKLSKATSGNIEIRGLLITSGGISNPTGSQRKQGYSNDELGTMVNMAGIPAGFMPDSGNQIQGINGSWKVSTRDWSFGPKINPGYLVALLTDTLTMNPSKPKPPYKLSDLSYGKTMRNNTGKYIQINIRTHCKEDVPWKWGKLHAEVNGLRLAEVRSASSTSERNDNLSFIVPSGLNWRIIKESASCHLYDNDYVVTELN